MQNKLSSNSLLVSVQLEARAGRVLMSRAVEIISAAKAKRQLPDGRFALSLHEWNRLVGCLLRCKKADAKILLSCLIEIGVVECSPARDSIIFSLKMSEVPA